MPNAIGTNEIGTSFGAELAAAGLAGLPFSWGADGAFSYDASITPAQKSEIAAVFAAHEPASQGWIVLQRSARAALTASDTTVLRCAESGVAVPQSWRDYRTSLRAIMGTVVGNAATSLPTRPAFPAGT